MAWLVTLWAQAGDQIGPGGVAGWTSAGWTSAGLLAAVLGWLLGKHVPMLFAALDAKDKQLEAKDKQLKEFIDSRDTLFRELWGRQIEQWRSALAESQKNEMEQRVDFQSILQRIQEHCQREAESLGKAIVAELRSIIGVKKPREGQP